MAAKDRSTPAPAGKGGIYQIRCLKDGKVYIGSAVRFVRRWGQHRYHLTRGDHHNSRLQRAWSKHGPAQFVFEALEIVDVADDLLAREQDWLDRIRPFNRATGYNHAPTAGSNLGSKRSREAVEKAAKALLGRPRPPEVIAKIAATRSIRTYTCSEETRKKTSENGRGRACSRATRKKISEAKRGKKHSAQSRANMSAAHVGKRYPGQKGKRKKGWKRSPEAIEASASFHRGRKRPPETCARMSASRVGMKYTGQSLENKRAECRRRAADPSFRAKMADIAKKRWAEWRKAKESEREVREQLGNER